MQHFREKEKIDVSSVWMYIYNLNRKVWKNFKATDESLFKANVFTVNEISVNFQPFFSLKS